MLDESDRARDGVAPMLSELNEVLSSGEGSGAAFLRLLLRLVLDIDSGIENSGLFGSGRCGLDRALRSELDGSDGTGGTTPSSCLEGVPPIELRLRRRILFDAFLASSRKPPVFSCGVERDRLSSEISETDAEI